MDVISLSHAEILHPDAAFHLVRAELSTSRPRALHDHDFFELIWIQNGAMRHHLAGGFREELSEGDLLFIRPGDTHALQGRGDAPLCVSLLLRPRLVRHLGKRHGFTRFFWSDGERPDRRRRDIRQLSALNKAALRLEQAPPTELEAQAFLLPLLAELCDDVPDLPADSPDWLISACLAARSPDVFRDGAAGFVRVSGRTHPHVSRTTQKFLGQSPSDYINTIRMNYAARALTGSPESLPEIAAMIGLPNMSHFHKLFREQFGTTPFKYRKAHQRDVVQPGA